MMNNKRKSLVCPCDNINQKIAFGILCALEVYKDEKFRTWADSWLSGSDRSYDAAKSAESMAWAAAEAAAAGVAIARARVAESAAEAAVMAASAESMAMWVANAAAAENKDMNLAKLAKKARKIK